MSEFKKKYILCFKISTSWFYSINPRIPYWSIPGFLVRIISLMSFFVYDFSLDVGAQQTERGKASTTAAAPGHHGDARQACGWAGAGGGGDGGTLRQAPGGEEIGAGRSSSAAGLRGETTQVQPTVPGGKSAERSPRMGVQLCRTFICLFWLLFFVADVIHNFHKFGHYWTLGKEIV